MTAFPPVPAKPASALATPRHLERFLCLDDFEAVARRRLPRQIYGYYSGAAETNRSLRANRESYAALALLPRVLVDTRARSTAASLFRTSFSLPVGIAPMGLSALSSFRGDIVLARAAAAEDALMVASATSLTPLETMAATGGARWFQAYLPGDRARIAAMLRRVGAAGFETIVLTADVQVPANRENNARSGFSMPLRPTPRLFWDGALHPRWSLGTFLRTLARGMPHFENMDAFRGPAILSRSAERNIGTRDGLCWEHVAFMRDHWKGRLVIKGILSPADVALARAAGIDGVWLSNHGGRQLDSAIAPLLMLPEARREAGQMAVLIDGGVRRGTDVLKALALGADFVFVGRPFLYASVAAGTSGVRHALRLVRAEIARDMAMLGVNTLGELSPAHIRHFAPAAP
ncbi:L-lactate dehydrogenase [Gluconacetobacter sacchari DSM 12717]|uniref:Alpha-hydroxy-acid oxidizing protein n=2 Tax=Gluconacetobacter sacchari TaxID=92759 RepID=A0A7W4IDX6_9PROT|nr:alpha-hydroxy acid oxidase [Gluconacetobacter sacchari]MBB2161073.1 alpha-hydroxy-acid oxidizing protein [Gluconacetobacter sacchari]GBQ26365.1 L-lactate dehydrogenase [Gluconacetobacter sacchari DSM 12717]